MVATPTLRQADDCQEYARLRISEMRDVMVVLWHGSIDVWTKKIVDGNSLRVLLEARCTDG